MEKTETGTDGEANNKNAPPPEDDADLEDLLSPNDRSLKGAMDKLADNESGILISPFRGRISIIEFICAYISLFVMKKPRLASCIVVSFLLGLFLVVNLTLSNGSNVSLDSVIETDYSAVKSKYDLRLGQIDHWCLGGGDKTCRCEDPLEPVSREVTITSKTVQKKSAWSRAHDRNKKLVTDSIEEWGEDGVDVVFLGENIVEFWAGTSMSYNSTYSREIGATFSKMFNKEKKGKFNGIPLGIAGDTAPNVLWRIQNGEIPDNLNPKVWWIVIGTNDLSMRQCSEEVVLLGILRVIEEILFIRPDAKIVVNSILPMTTDKHGIVPKISDEHKKNKLKTSIGVRRALKKTAEKGSELDPELLAASGNGHRKERPALAIKSRPTFFSMFSKVAMWPSAVVINEALKKFCVKHTHLTFFDSYEIFIEDPTAKVPAIDKDLMKITSLGLPTIEGHEQFLKAITLRLAYIFKKIEKNVVKKDANGKGKSKVTANKVKRKKEKKETAGDKKSTDKEDGEEEKGDE